MYVLYSSSNNNANNVNVDPNDRLKVMSSYTSILNICMYVQNDGSKFHFTQTKDM